MTLQGPLREVSTVGFILISDFPLMTYASAVEPLRAANQIAGQELYRWWHAAPGNLPAVASNGAAILPDFQIGQRTPAPDLLLVCAGGNPSTFNDRAVFAWLRSLARDGVTIGGLSGGAFILARAGLLDGRRCTIHWVHMPAFQETFPEIELTRSLFEFDGSRVTCSGGIAGLDMMIELIGRDHGHELATAVSEWFLHTHVREGLAPQRMDLRFRLGVGDEKVLAALRIMEANLETPLSRKVLAQRCGTSLRQLERSFKAQVGRGLHEHYLSLRIWRARQLLVESSLPMVDVAVATGFRSASHFSRAFRSAVGSSPSELRRKHHRKA